MTLSPRRCRTMPKFILKCIRAQWIEKKQVPVSWRDMANRDLPRRAQGADMIEENNTAGRKKAAAKAG